jgi:hypothetical protein
MKSTSLISVGFLLLLMALSPMCQYHLEKKRSAIFQETTKGYIVPSQFSGPAALEFKGLVSDFLYLKISTYIGGKIMNRNMMDSSHADFFYEAANIITDLDPYFWDAYLMISMFLAWDFGRVDLANKLLEKATIHRTWDYKPPYYLGFYSYYFLKDNATASKYLMEAAKRGGGGSFLAPLATRLSVYQNDLTPAILFLKEQLGSTQDPVMSKHLKTRLQVILTLDRLEKKVMEFKKHHGHYPEKITDLIAAKLIDHIPEDPYGGKFYIKPDGHVYTTSNLRFSK